MTSNGDRGGRQASRPPRPWDETPSGTLGIRTNGFDAKDHTIGMDLSGCDGLGVDPQGGLLSRRSAVGYRAARKGRPEHRSRRSIRRQEIQCADDITVRRMAPFISRTSTTSDDAKSPLIELRGWVGMIKDGSDPAISEQDPGSMASPCLNEKYLYATTAGKNSATSAA